MSAHGGPRSGADGACHCAAVDVRGARDLSDGSQQHMMPGRYPMNHAARYNAAVSLILLAAVVGACTPDRDAPSARDLFPRGGEQPAGRVTMVKVHVAVVEVPMGATSESTILWALLDRRIMAMDEAISLADNGLQIGVGKRADWGRLDDVLTDMSGRQYEPTTIIGAPEAPVPIVVQEHRTGRTVFLVHMDDTLSGLDYPPGQYILSLLFTADPDGRTLTVTGLPQVQSTRRRPMIVGEEGSAAMVNRATTYSLYPLTFQMRVTAGDFIVIGASERITRASSAGRAFLARDRNGVPVETILVITPEIVTREIDHRISR